MIILMGVLDDRLEVFFLYYIGKFVERLVLLEVDRILRLDFWILEWWESGEKVDF